MPTASKAHSGGGANQIAHQKTDQEPDPSLGDSPEAKGNGGEQTQPELHATMKRHSCQPPADRSRSTTQANSPPTYAKAGDPRP